MADQILVQSGQFLEFRLTDSYRPRAELQIKSYWAEIHQELAGFINHDWHQPCTGIFQLKINGYELNVLHFDLRDLVEMDLYSVCSTITEMNRLADQFRSIDSAPKKSDFG